MELDAGKVIDKLLLKNKELTFQNAILEVTVEELTTTNKALSETLMEVSNANERKGVPSEEVNEDSDDSGAYFGVHDHRFSE